MQPTINTYEQWLKEAEAENERLRTDLERSAKALEEINRFAKIADKDSLVSRMVNIAGASKRALRALSPAKEEGRTLLTKESDHVE